MSTAHKHSDMLKTGCCTDPTALIMNCATLDRRWPTVLAVAKTPMREQQVTQQKLHLALLEDHLFRIQNLQELVSIHRFVSICIMHLLLTWIFPRIKYEHPNSVGCQYWYSVMLVSKERLLTMMQATESLIPCNTDVLYATKTSASRDLMDRLSPHNSNSRMEMMQQRSAHLSLPVPLSLASERIMLTRHRKSSTWIQCSDSPACPIPCIKISPNCQRPHLLTLIAFIDI